MEMWNSPCHDRIGAMDEHEAGPESLERLWDPELETLGEFLDQMAEDGAMDLEELDGFFELVPPNEYLPEILGDGLENGEIINGIETAQLLMQLILHHWNAVGDAFNAGDFFIPLLLEDEEGQTYGNNWASGFLRGVDMRKELWQEILGDEDKAGWFVPLFALVTENHPDPEMRPYQQEMTEEQREKLLAGVSVMVTEMYDYFEPHRRKAAASQMEYGKARKIGRNEPCYCGSGKKYKKCCGAIKPN
jgi:uncharacterized protein